MGFKKIDQIDMNYHDRSCVIMVNFEKKETVMIKNMIKLLGIKDIIEVSNDMYDNTVLDILENRAKAGEKVNTHMKVMLFNSLKAKQVDAIISKLKSLKVRGHYVAMVTENSINWPLKKIFYNLQEERKMLANKKAMNIHGEE